MLLLFMTRAKMKVSIIIPFFNKFHLVHSRLMELYKHVPKEDIEIILVNDASTEEKIDESVAWWQKHLNYHKIRYTINSENLGFGGAMNRGAEIAEGDVLVFLSNDVIVSGNFVAQILEKINDEVLIGAEVIYYPAGWNEFDVSGGKMVLPWANGWLLACTRKVWDALGGFDPRYGKYSYEDLDLTITAMDLGYSIIALRSEFAKHIGAQTAPYDAKRMEYTKRNREIFIEKWQDKLPSIHARLIRDGR